MDHNRPKYEKHKWKTNAGLIHYTPKHFDDWPGAVKSGPPLASIFHNPS